MLFFPHLNRRFRLRPVARRGFTLVEVTLALGVVGFAFVALLGMIPVGLSTFSSAMDTTVGTQIAQRMVQEAQQTDFLELTGRTTTSGQNASQRVLGTRYFDDQGNEVTDPARAIYHARMVVSVPTMEPGVTPRANYRMATLRLQVANNPGNQNLPVSGAHQQWAPGPAIVWHSAVISENR